MQIFEQKSTTKNGISLYSTKYNISKIILGSQSERCRQRSCFFRLKVRGERLKARSFYRLRSKLFYVIARGGVFSSCMCAGVRTCTSREHYIYYSVKGSITKRASESVKKRTYNLPSLTYARKADISNTNTCGSTLVESTASIF